MRRRKKDQQKRLLLKTDQLCRKQNVPLFVSKQKKYKKVTF